MSIPSPITLASITIQLCPFLDLDIHEKTNKCWSLLRSALVIIVISPPLVGDQFGDYSFACVSLSEHVSG